MKSLQLLIVQTIFSIIAHKKTPENKFSGVFLLPLSPNPNYQKLNLV